MAHPVESKRAHKVARERAAKIAGEHPDVREDRGLIREMVKESALKRAKGGRVPTININVAPSAPSAPIAPPLNPAMLAKPGPMPPPAPPLGGPPMGGLPGGGLPPGIAPRRSGGRVPGPGWTESMRTKTPVQHAPGKNDGKDIGRGKPITYKTGGCISSEGTPMGPKMPGGGRGGLARLAKARTAKRGS